MTTAEHDFLAVLAEEGARAHADLRDGVAKLEATTAAMVNGGEEAAWSEIEKAATSLVEKSDHVLTREQAVDRYLRTPAGAKLYAQYQDAHASRLRVIEGGDHAAGQRHARDLAGEQFDAIVEKAMDAGMSDMDATAWAADLRPDLADVCGIERRAPVAKGQNAWQAIEAAAQAVMRRRPSLSHAKAIGEALARDPGLYSAYLAEVNGQAHQVDDKVDEPVTVVAPTMREAEARFLRQLRGREPAQARSGELAATVRKADDLVGTELDLDLLFDAVAASEPW